MRSRCFSEQVKYLGLAQLPSHEDITLYIRSQINSKQEMQKNSVANNGEMPQL